MGHKLAVLVDRFPKLSETFVVQEIRLLEELGFEIEIYAARRSNDEHVHDEVRKVRAPVHYLPRAAHELLLGNVKALLFYRGRYVSALAAAFREALEGRTRQLLRFLNAGWLVADRRVAVDGEIRHLHAHFFKRNSEVARWASRIAGVGYTVSAHAFDIYTSEPGAIRTLVAESRGVLTCTRFNADHLRNEVGADASKVHVVYHGVDTARFVPSNQTGPVTRMVAVGRLIAKKGLDDSLRALASLKKQGYDVHYDVYGDGPLRAELGELAAALGVDDRVVFHGSVTHAELISQLPPRSVLVCPSRELASGDRDGIPNALAEAMALEIPVVATRVSGIPELVQHEVTGLLVEQNDPEALARAVARLLDHPDEARRLGRAARKHVVEHFDCQRWIETCAKHLQDCSLDR